MDNLIKSVYSYDLSGNDVQTITRGKAVIRLYKDLLKFNNIIDFIGKTQNCIMLFPVASDTSGHWIAILYNPKTKTISHFDSYGLSWKQERTYTDNEYVKRHLLGNLYDKAIQEGYKVVYNNVRLQRMRDGINTCGRWATLRIRFSYLTNEEFAKLFIGQTLSPDWYVSILTFICLKEDETDEENIVRMLGKMPKKN